MWSMRPSERKNEKKAQQNKQTKMLLRKLLILVIKSLNLMMFLIQFLHFGFICCPSETRWNSALD